LHAQENEAKERAKEGLDEPPLLWKPPRCRQGYNSSARPRRILVPTFHHFAKAEMMVVGAVIDRPRRDVGIPPYGEAV